MSRILAVVGLVLSTGSLAVVMAVSALLAPSELDMTLNTTEIWLRAQSAREHTHAFTSSEEYTFRSDDGVIVNSRFTMRADTKNGVAWVISATDLEGAPPLGNEPADDELDPAVERLMNELGMIPTPGDTDVRLELIYLRDVDWMYGRVDKREWRALTKLELGDDLGLEELGELPAGMHLVGKGRVHGKPTYRLVASTPGWYREYQIDAEFHVVQETDIFGDFQKSVVTYSRFNEPVNLPAGIPK